jgi:hypothetical protein
MIRRIAIAALLLSLWEAAPARANELTSELTNGLTSEMTNELSSLGRGDLVSAAWLEIEIDLGGGSDAIAALGQGAVDLLKGLAALPGRVARQISELACACHAAPDAERLRHWVRQGLFESAGRLRASQPETTVGSPDVEVETVRSTAGEAVDWSNGEFGWAVRTPGHVLIIVEGSEQRAAEMPTLWINRGIRDRSEEQGVAVFTSSTISPEAGTRAPGRPTAIAGDGMEITAYRDEDHRVNVLVRISGPVILHADDWGA